MTKELPVRTYTSAGGVVIDAHGTQVLTLLRPDRPGPSGEPEVRLPKGHIEQDESRQQAALREVQEEAGLEQLEVLADLGHRRVEFDWSGYHYIRDESYFLMRQPSGVERRPPESQFEVLWLSWEDALVRLSFEAEREWVQRARNAWTAQLDRGRDGS